jgi:hypothetical protein
MECVLKDKWDLWYHSITDNKWGKSSYNKLSTIENLYDYKYSEDLFKQDHYQNGMFFYMKDGVFPNWEDPDNREGGCLSFKVFSKDIIEEWNELFLKCITGNILKDNNDEINGISISPKKEFNIIKLWFKDDDFDYKKQFIEYGEYFTLEKALYKKHDIK